MSVADAASRHPGCARVAQALARHGHPHAPRWLDAPARSAADAAAMLGVTVGQIAKSIVFRRVADDAAVLVVAAGDRRVDEARVAALAGPLARADAAFVKSRTGFSIGGVAPLAHAHPSPTWVDASLLRFDCIWAAAGHPNAVFRLAPRELLQLTGAPAVDIAAAG